MKNIILLNKKEGETPLEALENFRRRNKKYEKVKMTYAGRLDPLVSGLLVILAGDIRHEKEKYLKLSKEYEFEILFGFATDTYDVLGKVVRSKAVANIEVKDIRENLKFFTGKFIQKYPLYSSKTLKYARSGQAIKRPEREVEVKSLRFLKIRKIAARTLLQNIERRVKKVKGDFRQREILKIWDRELGESKTPSFFAASFKIKCSGGTYVRAIANDLGVKLGVPALALTIRRTKIGKWKIK